VFSAVIDGRTLANRHKVSDPQGLAVSVGQETGGSGLGPSRVRFIDATRGLAMLLVLLSHFAQVYVLPSGWALTLISEITLIATPTFVIISGTLIGFLYKTRPNSFAGLRTKLVDRGLFLLIIGHVLILHAHLAMHSGVRWLFITDVIGVSIIVGPWLVARMGRTPRLSLSFGLYALSWLAVAAWHPGPGVAIAVKETFFGSFTPAFYSYAFPLLPWFSLDLASTVLGERLGDFYLDRDLTAMSRLLAKVALTACLVAVGAALATKHLIGPMLNGGQGLVHFIYALRAVDQKYPPGPVFVLLHGGIGVGLMSACLWAERHQFAERLLRSAAEVGQCSLFAYILQYYVYYTVLHVIHAYLPFRWAWPFYFAATALVIVTATLEWHRRGFNRYLTVGYGAWPWYGAAIMFRRVLFR
jgi:hypothetical protein